MPRAPGCATSSGSIRGRASETSVWCGVKTGANFEIFQYEADDQSRTQPRNSDIGGHHLAFYVDDIVSATAYLREKGVRILDEPEFKTEGPSGGEAWVYFLSPWGMQMELVSFPRGKRYEADFSGRLWDPRAD